MNQRFLYTTLKNGLDAIQADLSLLEIVFDQFNFSVTEIAGIKELFQKTPPTVKHQYARSDDTFPLYSIVLGGESESDLFIGNDAGTILDEDDEDYQADVKSSLWEHTFQILCYSGHPDATGYFYEVAKSIFILADLSEGDLFQTHFSGMDLSPDPRYIPEHLFARMFTIKAKSEFVRVDRDSRLGKAYRVGGIHVDKSGSPSDVGAVNTRVTVTTDGDS